MYGLKRFTLNQNDISFLDQQVTFPTIHVVGYNAAGDPLYGYSGSDGKVHVLGILAASILGYSGRRIPLVQRRTGPDRLARRLRSLQ